MNAWPARPRPWALLLLAVLGAAACGARTPRSFDLPRAKDVRALERIDREGGTLAWGGLRLGMSVTDVEDVLGERLPLSEVPRTDLGCEADYGTTVHHKGISVGLGFDEPGRSGRLREITLILPVPARDELVAALKDRFPGLRYVPARRSPDLREREDGKPMFRTGSGELIFVDPGVGVSFGTVCGAEPAELAAEGG